mgnify:CR=1 FL=1
MITKEQKLNIISQTAELIEKHGLDENEENKKIQENYEKSIVALKNLQKKGVDTSHIIKVKNEKKPIEEDEKNIQTIIDNYIKKNLNNQGTTTKQDAIEVEKIVFDRLGLK